MNKVDLNLLFTLRVLLKLRSTTLAAQELKTSQSAVSRSLIKLREITGDELLVRKGQKLELTVRGQELAEEVPLLLSQASSIFEPKSFNPKSCTDKLTIAMNASIAEWIVPLFIQYLSKEAPNIELTVDDWGVSTPQQLSNGDTRMGINYFPIDLPKSFIQRKVGQDDFVLVCRRDHPLSNEAFITLEHIKQYSFAVHVMKDWNDLAPRAEEILNEYDLKLKVQFRCRHLSIVLRILLESDLIFFSPKLTAEQLDERFIAIPIAEHLNRPSGDIGLFYANHYSSDPMTLWLEKAFKIVIKKAHSAPSSSPR